MGKLLDLTGLKFSRLLVTGRSEKKSNAGALWSCVCDCGAITYAASLKLREGLTKSCGCLKIENAHLANFKHGQANKTKTYKTWKCMRARCTNPKSSQWKWYGGKGVKVCESWNTYDNFLADMGPRPEGHTLDRIDSMGNYEPENCRWATPKQQAETNSGCFKPWRNAHSRESEGRKLSCKMCNDNGWVCENHTNIPWGGGEGECECGAGQACTCNPSGNVEFDVVIASVNDQKANELARKHSRKARQSQKSRGLYPTNPK